MSAFELYLVVVVHLAVAPAVAYPLLWSLHGTWSHNRVGRALMFKAASLGALFLVAVARFWLPVHLLSYLYAATVTTVAAALYWQLWVLVGVLREGRSRRGVSD
jgi:hypothetical protein